MEINLRMTLDIYKSTEFQANQNVSRLDGYSEVLRKKKSGAKIQYSDSKIY